MAGKTPGLPKPVKGSNPAQKKPHVPQKIVKRNGTIQKTKSTKKGK